MANVQTLSKGEQTRERILDIAQDAVLHKGFAGTSLDEIIAEAGITKSGFFYHFKDKNDLAKALLQRYLDTEWSVFDALFKKADDLSEDPLHSFLIFLKLFAELMGDLPNGHPGCLVSSYVYSDHMFSRDVREMTTEGHRIWRRRFRERAGSDRRALSVAHRDQSRRHGRHALSRRRWRDHLVEELERTRRAVASDPAIPRLCAAGVLGQLSRHRLCARHAQRQVERESRAFAEFAEGLHITAHGARQTARDDEA